MQHHKNLIASTAEYKTVGIYIEIQHTWPIFLAAIELVYLQPQIETPMYTDNSTTKVVLNASTHQKRLKAFDVRFYWMSDYIH